MNMIALNRENIIAYQKLLPPDIAENIGRMGYYGIAGEQSVLVWRQSSITDIGEILFYSADNAQAADALLAEYEKGLVNAGITKSELELPADLGQAEQEALGRSGYVLSNREGRVIHTTVSQLAALPIADSRDLPQIIGNTGTLSIRQFEQGIRSCQETGVLEDARALSPAWFDQKLSCHVLIDGRVCGYLLIHRLPSGALRPEMFYVIEPAVRRNLLDMIRYVIFQAQERLGGDTPVFIPRYREVTRALTDKLLPGLRGDTVLAAVRKLNEKRLDQ